MSRSMLTKDAWQQLHQASQPTYRLMMTDPLTLIGVGTSGCNVLLLVFALLWQKTGRRLPRNVRFIAIEADRDPRDRKLMKHMRYVRFIRLGKTGAGTVIAKGRKQAESKFSDIKTTLQTTMKDLMATDDPRFPTSKSASSSQAVALMAGSGGGCGGGATDTVITAAHEAARLVGLDSLDVHLSTIGPSAAVRDVTHSIERQRRWRIAANSAENGQSVYGQMNTRHAIEIDLPGGGTVRIDGATRITTNTESDWDNGDRKLLRCADLHAVMATSLFHRLFTAVGARRDSRHRDEIDGGYTGAVDPGGESTIEEVTR